METAVPYCGPAPVPGEVLSTWNFDPLLLPMLATTLLAVAWTSRRALRSGGLSAGGFVGCLLLFIAFVSPICALSTALFSARVAHHLILVAFAAPALALAFPTRFPRIPLSALVLAHTLLMWVWHAPLPYQWALSSVPVYWTMELTLLLSAVAMWQGIFVARTGPALGALLASIVQMGMLGALLTFAGSPLYEPHLMTTLAFGLTPLDDQRLAGLLMWVPAALPYLAVALFLAWRQLGNNEAYARDGRR